MSTNFFIKMSLEKQTSFENVEHQLFFFTNLFFFSEKKNNKNMLHFDRGSCISLTRKSHWLPGKNVECVKFFRFVLQD